MLSDYYAKPLKNESIYELAYVWREALGIERDEAFVDIVRIVENVVPTVDEAYSLVVEPSVALDNVEAYTEFSPPKIVVRENVYLAAMKKDSRARWTFAHELGHLMLHDSAVPVARAPDQYKTLPMLPAYASTEKQADKFAAAFLMPDWIVDKFASIVSLATACGVSFGAAKARLERRARYIVSCPDAGTR